MSDLNKGKIKQCRRKVLRFLALSVAVIVLMASMSMSAFAEMDITESCSLKLLLPANTDDSEVVLVTTDLYKVGDARVYGGDYYKIRLNEKFDGLMDFTTDVDFEPEDWGEAAQATADKVRDEDIDPIASKTNAGSGDTPEESVEFDNLDAGLYLVLIHGSNEDYFAEIDDPEGDGKKIVTTAETYEFKYQFTPALIALPSKNLSGDGTFDILDEGDFIFDKEFNLVTEMKVGWEEKTGSIKITKDLLGYNPEYKATFVFDVEATFNGETVFSQVYTLDFDDYGEKTITIDGLKLGAIVTVEEVYSGAGYKLVVGEQKQTGEDPVTPDSILEFSFTNDYTKTEVGGGGILNEFTYNGTTWEWDENYNHDSSDPVSE